MHVSTLLHQQVDASRHLVLILNVFSVQSVAGSSCHVQFSLLQTRPRPIQELFLLRLIAHSMIVNVAFVFSNKLLLRK